MHFRSHELSDSLHHTGGSSSSSHHRLARIDRRLNNRHPDGGAGFDLPSIDMGNMLSFDLGAVLPSSGLATDATTLAVPTIREDSSSSTPTSRYHDGCGYAPTHRSPFPWCDAVMDAMDRASKTVPGKTSWWFDPEEVDEKVQLKEKAETRRLAVRSAPMSQTFSCNTGANTGSLHELLSKLTMGLKCWLI